MSLEKYSAIRKKSEYSKSLSMYIDFIKKFLYPKKHHEISTWNGVYILINDLFYILIYNELFSVSSLYFQVDI